MNLSSAGSHRSFVLSILVAAVAAGSGLWFSKHYFSAPATPKLADAVLYPQPRPVPDFHLEQTNGRALTSADWHGHWNVVYFGYTNCPDVCPTTLATFKETWKQLGQLSLQDKVRIDFISVDPDRDTPAQLGKYVGYFSPNFIAATGSDDELTRLSRALGLVYTRTKAANGNIEVDHSGSAVIIDPQVRLVGLFRPPFAAQALAADLATLAAAGN